jgi:DNA-binding MarR family transcriptional regulator
VPTPDNILPLRELLRILVRKMGILERSEASCCSITISQCHALVEIGRAGSLSVNQLADRLGLDKSTVSRSLEKLVNDGLVLREEDTSDRRYLLVRHTTAGAALCETIENRMNTYFNEVIHSIPAEKLAQIEDSLHYLTEALRKQSCC